jgi:RimJ/RimL family protein N-acetyltransferase
MDESDLPTIERAASDAEILKWFDLHARSPADYLAAKRDAWAEGTGASFAICDATLPDTCLGQVFIERDDDGRGSVGYWLLEDGRGKGRATRAVRLMASWALPEMRLGRLQLHTDPENVASQRVAEREGRLYAGGRSPRLQRSQGRHPRRCFRLLAASAGPSAHPFRQFLLGAGASAARVRGNVPRPEWCCTTWGA